MIHSNGRPLFSLWSVATVQIGCEFRDPPEAVLWHTHGRCLLPRQVQPFFALRSWRPAWEEMGAGRRLFRAAP